MDLKTSVWWWKIRIGNSWLASRTEDNLEIAPFGSRLPLVIVALAVAALHC